MGQFLWFTMIRELLIPILYDEQFYQSDQFLGWAM
jgi:hypothetical protein